MMLSDAVRGVLSNATLHAEEKVVLLAVLDDLLDEHREPAGFTARIELATGMGNQTVRRAFARLSGRHGLFHKRISRSETQFGWENHVELVPRYRVPDELLTAASVLNLDRPAWRGYAVSVV